MADQEKLSREEVLQKLSIAEDTLTLYEHELQMSTPSISSGNSENFTEEDLHSIQTFHKLRESGLTYNEIKLLSSFSEILMNIDFEGNESIKKLLSLSPIYRLKQSLNLARQELSILRNKALELEESLKKELESKFTKSTSDISTLQLELDAKQKIIINLDRRLSEALTQKAQLEIQISSPQVKSKKAKQLQETLIQKEKEISELTFQNREFLKELEHSKEESYELKERLELTEEEIVELEHEIEERYKEQLTTLREQIEALVDNKQKEWESYYISTSEQHKKEILTLQKKHEQDILHLKHKIREQIEEIEELKSQRNPLVGLLRMGSGKR